MKPLAGVRVVDLTMWAFVPAAGGVLAHWGADVIKVESPDSPDPMRLFHNGSLAPGDSGWMFKHYSRGKRSLVLNLKADQGREILYSLVREADVFLTSYLPATRKKLGFDVEQIREVNPQIIYVRGSGQGPNGPDAERGGYDSASWWCRGTLAQTALDFTDTEFPPGMIGHGDGISGLSLAGGICAALLQRERTGVPAVVDGTLMGTALWFNSPSVISAGLGQQWAQRLDRTTRLPTMNDYRTKDGRFLELMMLGDKDRDWQDLCKHLDRPELASDERFSSAAARQSHCAEGVEALDRIFAERTLDEWKKALATTTGVWAPVQTPAEAFDDPQTLANGFLRSVDYVTGPLRLPSPPILFDEDPGDPPPAPDYGEHTDVILESLGFDGPGIDKLRSEGIVG